MIDQPRWRELRDGEVLPPGKVRFGNLVLLNEDDVADAAVDATTSGNDADAVVTGTAGDDVDAVATSGNAAVPDPSGAATEENGATHAPGNALDSAGVTDTTAVPERASDLQAAGAWLAALNEAERELQCPLEAKRLGVPEADLDKAIKQALAAIAVDAKTAAVREAAMRLARLPELERELQQKNERERLGVSVSAMKAAIREALEAEAEAAVRQATQADSEPAEDDPRFTTADEPAETDDEVIARLAKLAPLDYARVHEAEAKRLGIKSVAIIDRLVSEARGTTRHPPGNDENNKPQGRALVMAEPEPWPDPVNGAALMDEVVACINRHVILPTGGAVAIALWCVHTFLLGAFRHTPRLTISSSDPDCGKTTTLDIVAMLVFRPLSTAGISGAAFYRTVEHAHPTFLADEGDSYLHENEELRGCFNAGHKRGGQMIKCVGEDFEPRAFDVFCALAIAMIGLPPATVLSRSISIRMRRAAPGDQFEPLTEAAEQAFVPLVRKIARWTADNTQAVAEAKPALPTQLVNRKGDNWRPLFLIAEAFGGHWPERLRKAAEALLAQAASDPQSLGVMALEDIRSLFQQRGNPDHLPSADIVTELLRLEERPWGALGKVEKPLTTNRLARLLAPYAIAPGTIRVGANDTPKGYKREQFEDAWKRYLQPLDTEATHTAAAANAKYPPQGGIKPPQRHNPQESAVFPEFEPPQTGADVAVGKLENSRDSATCGVVADGIHLEGAFPRDDDDDGASEAVL